MGNKSNSASKPLTEKEIIADQQKKYICKIYMYLNGILCGLSNGFFCLIPYPDQEHLIPVLITTHRTIDEKSLNENKEIKLSLNNDKKKITIKLNDNRKIYTSKEHDTTIIEIKPKEDKIHDFLELDDNLLKENLSEIYNQSKIYLICYGKENKMDMYYGTIKEIEGKEIHHISDTESGSGGCPILSTSNYKVIGLHLGRTPYEYKKGIIMNIPLKEFMTGEKFFKFS